MKFLSINGDLLANTHLNPTDKLIVSFLYNLGQGGKAFFGSFEYLGREFGLNSEYIEKRFLFLEGKKIIKKAPAGWVLEMPLYELINFGG